MFATSDLESGTVVITPVAALSEEFVTSGGTSTLVVVAPPGRHEARFVTGDILRIAAPGFEDPANATASVQFPGRFWLPGGLPQAVPCDVWLQVTDVADEVTHFAYTVTHLHGPHCRFLAGTVVIRYGQTDDQRILLSSVLDGAPFVDLFRVGDEPWVDSPRLLRLGNLETLIAGGGSGIVTGTDLSDEEQPAALFSNAKTRLNRTPFSITDGATETVAIAPNGDLRVGRDLAADVSTALHVDVPGNAVKIRTKVRLFDELRSQGALALTSNGKVTLLATPDGSFKIGADVEDAEQTTIHYDATTRKLSLLGPVRAAAGLHSDGQVTLAANGKTTVRINPDGSAAFGADVDQPGQTALRIGADGQIDIGGSVPAGGNLGNGGNLNVGGSATVAGMLNFAQAQGTGSVALGADGNRTVEMRADGTVKFGPNVTASSGTRFQFEAVSGKLFISAGTHFSAPVEVRDTLHLTDDLKPRIWLAANGDVRFGEDASAPAVSDFVYSTADRRVQINVPLVLNNNLISAGNVTLGDDSAFVFGQNENIRIDKNGINMRLLPGAANSINVFAMGRAATLNAYQTTESTQAVDLLAYYNAGVPALHGRNTFGVADAAGGEPDLYLRLTRFHTGARNAELKASFVDVTAERIHLRGNVNVRAGFEFSGTGDASRLFRLQNLPTSSSGLPSGAVWNDGGTLRIVV